MESNIIDKQIYEDLISQVDARKLDLASKLMQNKAIAINKITYDNKQNFEYRGSRSCDSGRCYGIL